MYNLFLRIKKSLEVKFNKKSKVCINIKTYWYISKIKNDEEQKLNKYKLSIVAKGYSQTYVDEGFASLVKQAILRLLFIITGNQNMFVKHFDVKPDFFNEDLSEVMYKKQPEGYIREGEHLVCHLTNSIYFLKLAPRTWNIYKI